MSEPKGAVVPGPMPMTAGRRLALILGVPLALAIIAWTAITEVAFAGVGSYPVRLAVPVRGSTVRLSLGAADAQVTQAAGGTLRLTGTARYSIVRSSVTWHAGSSGVTVAPRCHFITGICSFSFRAVLPAGKRALISTGSGDITGTGLSGDLSVSTGSGNIGITGLAGAHVTASAGSGDITLTFTRIPVHVTVSNGSGNVTLVLPPGRTRYRVSASTDSGSRTVTVPTDSGSPYVIKVTDGSGNVSVTN
jgi:hypothetical protein